MPIPVDFDRILKVGDEGQDVKELQIRLSGFKYSTVPDGVFSEKTKKCVITFQKDFMGISPSGEADKQTLEATEKLGTDYPFDNWQGGIGNGTNMWTTKGKLRCPCNDTVCQDTYLGFGHNDNDGEYRTGFPKIEAYHQKEYLGIHRCLLWSIRAALFYNSNYNFSLNSGYRCRTDNIARGRTSTNHMGKAVDIDPGESTQCDDSRRRIVEKCNAQIRWNNKRKKSLEPRGISPTWVHYDVREYGSPYLDDEYFVRNETELNNFGAINITENSDETADELEEENTADAQKEVVATQRRRTYDVSPAPTTPASPCGLSSIQTTKFTQMVVNGFLDQGEGLNTYITTEDSYDVRAITTGTLVQTTPAAATIPISEEMVANVYWAGKSKESLAALLQSNTSTGIPTGGIINYFNALNTWLHTPSVTIGLNISNSGLLNSNQVKLIPPDSGGPVGLHGIVTFPTVLAMGTACQAEMLSTSFPQDSKKARIKAWEIMNKYIKLALNTNLIAPIPTAGTSPSFPGIYTGITTVFLTWKDQESEEKPIAQTQDPLIPGIDFIPLLSVISSNLIYNEITGRYEKSTEEILNPTSAAYVTDSNGLAVPTDSTVNLTLSAYALSALADEVPVNVNPQEAEKEFDYTYAPINGLNQNISAINDYATYVSETSADINTINEGAIEMKVTLTIVVKNPIITTKFSPLPKQKPTGILKRH